MFRNSYYYQGISLGSSISEQDDIFKGLAEGREKAGQIARALGSKIDGVTAGDIEIHCKTYDPQYWLQPEWAPRADTMSIVPGTTTLKGMKV